MALAENARVHEDVWWLAVGSVLARSARHGALCICLVLLIVVVVVVVGVVVVLIVVVVVVVHGDSRLTVAHPAATLGSADLVIKRHVGFVTPHRWKPYRYRRAHGRKRPLVGDLRTFPTDRFERFQIAFGRIPLELTPGQHRPGR